MANPTWYSGRRINALKGWVTRLSKENRALKKRIKDLETDMAKKVAVWESDDGTKFSSRVEAEKRDDKIDKLDVQKSWDTCGTVESGDELYDWVIENIDLVARILRHQE